MDTQITHHIVTISRRPNALVDGAPPTSLNRMANFKIETTGWFRIDPYYDAADAEFQQEVNTRIIVKRPQQLPQITYTGWHDDGYSIATGTWSDSGRRITFLDHPGVEVGPGCTLDYTFQFKQRFYHRRTQASFCSTPIFTVTMRGTFPDFVMAGEHTYRWAYVESLDLDRTFRTDVDF